jgi:hypothetical protein
MKEMTGCHFSFVQQLDLQHSDSQLPGATPPSFVCRRTMPKPIFSWPPNVSPQRGYILVASPEGAVGFTRDFLALVTR